jgi:hypothetical protein
VSSPHGLSWDSSVARPSQRFLARAWPFGRGQLLPGDILEQEGQGPVEERAGIAVRDLAAEEILGSAQLLVRRGADGELHAVALRRQRGDRRPLSRRPRRGSDL